jgi:hypothetical protein
VARRVVARDVRVATVDVARVAGARARVLHTSCCAHDVSVAPSSGADDASG